jgi:hypothetical protein
VAHRAPQDEPGDLRVVAELARSLRTPDDVTMEKALRFFDAVLSPRTMTLRLAAIAALKMESSHRAVRLRALDGHHASDRRCRRSVPMRPRRTPPSRGFD